MNNLLTPTEVENILRKVRIQKFVTNRKNAAPWCMQWLSLFFALCFFTIWLLQGQWQINRNLFLASLWIGIAALSNIQWKRYKERLVLRQTLDKIEGEQAGPGYPPQGVGSPDP